ncbi:MAG: NHLP-related RiPP peptide [Dokdonella sp.]
MTDTSLTQDQARALLQKLAADDSFRTLFETAPAKALHDLGIDPATIVHLRPGCLCPRSLAPKDSFTTVLRETSEAAISSAMRMIIPQIGFK